MRRMRAHSLLQTGVVVGVLALGAISSVVSAAESTPQQVFDGMARSFRPEKAKGLHVRYQFDLTGPNGGDWFFDVNNGSFKTNRGKIANPDVVLMASDNDWVAISSGKLNGVWAYMTGRLKIKGDRNLAKKLHEIFP